MRRNQTDGTSGGFFLSLIRGSVILGGLDRLLEAMYRLLKKGFFGWIFTGYRNGTQSGLWDWLTETGFARWLAGVRRTLCRGIETSVLLHFVKYGVRSLLGCRLKVYGAFLVSFGAYTAAVAAVQELLAASASGALSGAALLSNQNLFLAGVVILAGLPLVLSKKNLSEGLASSGVGAVLLEITGFTKEDIRVETDGGHMSIAFLLGMICGAVTYSLSPFLLLLGFGGLIGAYLVLIRPEIGVLALIFLMPFLPTMLLAVLLIYTFLCYLLKVVRQKRVLRFEAVDIVFAAFALMMLSGGLFSVSDTSLKKALLYTCLMMGYFLVVQLIRTAGWLRRCTVAAVASAVVTTGYGLLTYLTGTAVMDPAWLDKVMFGSIRGRMYATLENPNMCGAYIALLFPVAVSFLLCRARGMTKAAAVVSIGVLGFGLISTWSRGAWLGLALAMVIYLLIWHRRTIIVMLCGVACLPVGIKVMQKLSINAINVILNRLTSIGDLSDSSTAYRVHTWQAVKEMIGDYFLTGFGTGEGAWYKIYPLYAYMGVEVQAHSHNLYYQLILEQGIFGIGFFLLFLFLLYQSGFTFFGKMSEKGVGVPERLTMASLPLSTDPNRNMNRSKTDLRLITSGYLCGLLAILAQGMTDHVWYNYRLFLMFWLVAGLASASVRVGSSLLEENPGDQKQGSRKYSVDLF